MSFLSIIIISMLGMTAYLSIEYSAYAMRKNGSDFYNEVNFRDIEIISTHLLSEADLESLNAVEGVKYVEKVRYLPAKAKRGETGNAADVISLTERLNVPKVKEGRLPAEMNECAVELRLAEKLDIKTGDALTVELSQNSEIGLKNYEFTVSGIVVHPDHTNNTVPDNPYVLVRYDVFDEDAIGDCFMKAEIEIEKSASPDRFSQEYEQAVSKVMKRVDAISAACEARRDEELVSGVIANKIDSLGLPDNMQPDEATKKNADALIAFIKGRLEDTYAELEDAKKTFRNKLKSAFDAAFIENENYQLIKWAETSPIDADDPAVTARYLWITENVRLDLFRSIEDIFRAIAESESVPRSLLVSFYKVMHDGADAPKTEDGTDYDYDAITEEIVNVALTDENIGRYAEMQNYCRQWDEGHSQYISALAQYREQMADFDPCAWLTFDSKGNTSFVQLNVGSSNFANLKSTFSLLFIIVGALVIFATVGKMVDEQRRLVGTTKALGFFNREIFAKYLVFGASATFIGTIFGVFVAFLAIEPFLLNGFAIYYYLDLSRSALSALPTVIAFVAGLALAAFSVWLACVALLREPAVRLMQPKAPAGKKKGASGRKKVLSLYSRLILLNMRTDLKRVIVTIVSIAGCCALIVVGFTLRSGVTGSIDKQYSNIVAYDEIVKYESEKPAAANEVEDVLKTSGAQYTAVLHTFSTYRLGGLQIAELICGDIKEIGRFYHMKDWNTGEVFESSSRGVLVQRRIAENYGLDVGSEFEIAIGGTKTAIVRVAGVYENYLGRTIVMSDEYYKRVFGEDVLPNAFYVKGGNLDADALDATLKGVDGYVSMTRSEQDKLTVESSISMVNTLIIIFILIAAIMAGVVQLNLTNMYIMQKKRELTIMRVNGFTVREVIGYVLRETVVTTIAGILAGFAIGSLIGYIILRTLEQNFIQFDRNVSLSAWLIGAAFTVFFTVIVNYIALRKVKNLKLTDAA